VVIKSARKKFGKQEKLQAIEEMLNSTTLHPIRVKETNCYSLTGEKKTVSIISIVLPYRQIYKYVTHLEGCPKEGPVKP